MGIFIAQQSNEHAKGLFKKGIFEGESLGEAIFLDSVDIKRAFFEGQDSPKTGKVDAWNTPIKIEDENKMNTNDNHRSPLCITVQLSS